MQAFFQRNTDSTDIYVHDEKGSLFHTQKNHTDEDTLLNPVRLFLQNIQYRCAAVAGYIASLRRKRERYPIYFTDLDLSGSASLQTVQFLQHKEKLESAINQALKLS